MYNFKTKKAAGAQFGYHCGYFTTLGYCGTLFMKTKVLRIAVPEVCHISQSRDLGLTRRLLISDLDILVIHDILTFSTFQMY